MTPAEVIRAAEDLEPSDWSAALELLEASNRSARSDEVEIALAKLRHRCFERLATTPPGSEPAEPSRSPAIGASGLPECGSAGLTAHQVRAALVEHGCLLVRGAVDAACTHALAEEIDRSFAAQELADSTETTSAWWSPLALDAAQTNSLGRKWVRGGGGVLLADAPRLLEETLDMYTALGLRAVVTDYLGSRPVLSANKCTLRRVAVTDQRRLAPGRRLSRDSGIRAINMWLTLTPCGVDAPVWTSCRVGSTRSSRRARAGPTSTGPWGQRSWSAWRGRAACSAPSSMPATS